MVVGVSRSSDADERVSGLLVCDFRESSSKWEREVVGPSVSCGLRKLRRRLRGVVAISWFVCRPSLYPACKVTSP